MVNVKTIESLSEYNSFINKDKKIVVFHAEWCSPCRLLEKNIVNLDETKFDVSFGEVNVDDDFADEITSSLGIRNIPVTIFFKDGKEIKRLVGLKTVQDLYNEINDAYS